MEGSDTEALKLLTLNGHLGDDLLGDFWQAVYFSSYTKMHFLKIKLYSLQPAELRQYTLKLQQELVLALSKIIYNLMNLLSFFLTVILQN